MTLRAHIKHWLHANCPGLAGSFRYFGVRVFFPQNSLVFRMLCEQGVYERENARMLASLAGLRPGGVVFDVGGNIGLMAIPVLDTCAQSRVISFEPSPRTFACLARTIAGSRYAGRWQAVEKAVAEKTGSAAFFSHPSGNDAYDGFADTQRADAARKVTVPVTTLDAEWEAIGRPPVSAIKIDIEGAELRAIEGAGACIAREQPAILTEWCHLNLDAHKCSAGDLLACAEKIGYRVFSLPEIIPVETPALLELHMLRTESFLMVPARGLSR